MSASKSHFHLFRKMVVDFATKFENLPPCLPWALRGGGDHNSCSSCGARGVKKVSRGEEGEEGVKKLSSFILSFY